MIPEEFIFRIEEASYNLLLKMEMQQLAAHEKVIGVLDRLSHSTLADKYREASGLAKELFFKLIQVLKEKAAHSESIKFMKEIAKSQLRYLARRISIASPYVHKALENRIAIAYVSLILGFIGGRYWMRGYPQLQPQQMLSVVCGSYSGPDGVALCRIPMPRLSCNYQVLVRVMSAGLDRSDLMAVSGWARLERGKPHGGFTLGRDFCGVVVEAGMGVTHLHPGDKVWGALPYHMSGTLSEHIVIPGSHVTKMPSNLNWEGGATVPYSTVQVWSALVTAGHLTPDQAAGVRVLILDGVTDTGSLAVQLCCLWGAHVTVVCSARAAQLAAALGAHMVIPVNDSEDSDLVTNIKRSGPYKLIVQCGDTLSKSDISSLLTPQTKLTSSLPTSLSSDGWGYIRRLIHPLWRSLVFSAPQTPKPSQVTEALNYVMTAVQRGKLQPVLASVLSPSEVSSALHTLATQDTVGKSIVMFDRL